MVSTHPFLHYILLKLRLDGTYFLSKCFPKLGQGYDYFPTTCALYMYFLFKLWVILCLSTLCFPDIFFFKLMSNSYSSLKAISQVQ